MSRFYGLLLKWAGIYGAEQGQTWLMTGTAAEFWRFEGEEWGKPYLLLRASAATPQSSTGTGSRFLTRGMWKGSAPAKLRHDNAARDRKRGTIMRGGPGEGTEMEKERERV